jgi:hypothetical protein
MHICDNPKCINIGHLREATQTENVADCVAKKRQRHLSGDAHPWRQKGFVAPAGERHGNSVLKETDVLFILDNPQLSQRKIAKQYGVCKSLIGAIRSGKLWKELYENWKTAKIQRENVRFDNTHTVQYA